jgi:hypothetical protein
VALGEGGCVVRAGAGYRETVGACVCVLAGAWGGGGGEDDGVLSCVEKPGACAEVPFYKVPPFLKLG